MQAVIHGSGTLHDALVSAGVEVVADASGPLVLEVGAPGDVWADVFAETQRVFRLSQAAAQSDVPVVYVVHSDDLLGRRGPGNAMVATGVLSAARTLAFEARKKAVPANVIAVDDETDWALAASWIVQALRGGVTGELIRMGGTHIGKALP